VPSITEFMEVATPIIEQKVAKAALEERMFLLRELGKLLARDPSLDQIRRWHEANLSLVAYVQEHRIV